MKSVEELVRTFEDAKAPIVERARAFAEWAVHPDVCTGGLEREFGPPLMNALIDEVERYRDYARDLDSTLSPICELLHCGTDLRLQQAFGEKHLRAAVDPGFVERQLDAAGFRSDMTMRKIVSNGVIRYTQTQPLGALAAAIAELVRERDALRAEKEGSNA